MLIMIAKKRIIVIRHYDLFSKCFNFILKFANNVDFYVFYMCYISNIFKLNANGVEYFWGKTSLLQHLYMEV